MVIKRNSGDRVNRSTERTVTGRAAIGGPGGDGGGLRGVPAGRLRRVWSDRGASAGDHHPGRHHDRAGDPGNDHDDCASAGRGAEQHDDHDDHDDTTTTPTTTSAAATTYRFPVDGPASYGRTHSEYPAADVFAHCGAPVVAPVDGTLLEVRRVDGWRASDDNPATRGGRSIAIAGDDGVRYYLAHLDVIRPQLAPGGRVESGQALATMGRTGRASGCHLHVGLSPPCPGKEWAVRRGVVWPAPYLDAWRAGEQRSPAAEIASWVAANPEGCAVAMADPHAAQA